MPTKKDMSHIPSGKLDFFKKLIDTNPKIKLKGATVPYISFNGHMFAYFEKDGSFGLRLSEPDRDLFLKKYKTTLFISYGIVKKEFVLVPDQLFGKMKEFKPWFDRSFKYVETLKAK